MFKTIKAVAIGLTLATTAGSALAQTVDGAGASFPYPIYAKWAEAYHQATGVQVNYQSIGSGGGIRQIKARTIVFGATDAPLPPEELEEAGLVQWPMVMGGVVPVVNIQGVQPGQLRLSNEVLADIFLGKITTWNDPAIQRLNPNLQLPSQRITTVYRSDGSGTTFVFTDFLSKVSSEFREQVGKGTAVPWPTGVSGRGNEGVSSYVSRVNGGIGYVEYAYALQNKLSHVQLRNREGQWVQPDSEYFQAAAQGADWQNAPGMSLLLTDQPGEKSWPITAATFILMHKQPQNPDAAREALKFFSWAFDNGGRMAEELHYVPMPKETIDYIKTMWRQQITGPNGQPLL